eukprot:TRINITY_DN7927_c0_g1_i4.p1 TRINITY_DN7927_c0_g1~~TRINITY_DN7927_c0_g1_i4.p1  ORF type:complete len:995 (-),score=215.28 TRINITY_DN7927_c0_g1_i4:794-3778(-)
MDLLNVVDASGEKYDTTLTAIKEESSCDYHQMKKIIEFYNNAINSFPLSSPVISDEVTWRYYGTLAPTLSNVWVNCMQYSREILLQPETQPTLIPNTKFCFEDPSSENYYTDPCCNIELQKETCCYPRNVTVNMTTYPESTSLEDLSSSCIANGASCGLELGLSLQSLVEKSFIDNEYISRCNYIEKYRTFVESVSIDLYDKCRDNIVSYLCNQDVDCSNKFGVNSYCVDSSITSIYSHEWSRECTIPCETNDDCYSGLCMNWYGLKRCSTLPNIDGFFNTPTQVDLILSCITKELQSYDNFLIFNFFEVLNLTADVPYPTFFNQLENKTTDTNCNPFYTSSPKDTNWCETSKTCSWIGCDNVIDSWCQENATFPGWTSYSCTGPAWMKGENTNYCGLKTTQNPIVYPDLSQFGSCRLDNTFGDSDPNSFDPSPIEICVDSFGGFWDDMATSCWQGPFTNVGDYLKDRFCPNVYPLKEHRINNLYRPLPPLNNGYFCRSTCLWEGATKDDCNTGGYYWSVHISNKITYSECHLPAINKAECDAYADKNMTTTFWPGKMWLVPQHTNEQYCKSYCSVDYSLSSKASCEAGYHCSNPLCKNCDKEACLSSGLCEAIPGCYLPFFPDGSCNTTTNWTPLGCYFKSSDLGVNEVTCQKYQGTYISMEFWKAMDKKTCESLASVCEFESKKSNFERQRSMGSQQPPWISWLKRSACEGCGGIYKPAFKWVPGEWINNDGMWVDLAWVPRQMKNTYQITKIVDPTKLKPIFNQAVAKRQMDLLLNHLICRNGQMAAILSRFACLCGSSGNEDMSARDCVEADLSGGVVSVPIAMDQACTGTPFVYEHYRFGKIVIMKDFSLPSSGCINMNVSLVPLAQFMEKKSKFGLIDNIPTTQKNRNQFIFVKNVHNVIVGVLVGDGVLISLEETPVHGITVCMNIPTDPYLYSNGQSLTYTRVDIGWSNINFDGVTATDHTMTLDTPFRCVNKAQFCFQFRLQYPL